MLINFTSPNIYAIVTSTYDGDTYLQILDVQDKDYNIPDIYYSTHTLHTTVDGAFTAAKAIDPLVNGNIFYGPIDIPTPTLTPSPITFEEGSIATISCYYPPSTSNGITVTPTYVWVKDNVLNLAQSSAIATVGMTEEDKGIYICRVRYDDPTRNRSVTVDHEFDVYVDVSNTTTTITSFTAVP